ncbi:MAG: nucleotidyl transferase AbiEii/AbiGii toxin family protein [Candidatus Cryptobacteroides sp.]
MSLWQHLNESERIAAIQTAAADKHIEERAVEKDWWVTAVLNALFKTSCRDYLLFKGGTSISKGWPIIERFSEDIDLSLGRKFFLEELGIPYAAAENNTQLMRLRKASRKFIHGTLSKELTEELTQMGISGFRLSNQTTMPSPEGPKPIDTDRDPTVITVEYESIFPAYEGDILPSVKIEISCLSMSEPFEEKTITSLIHDRFPELDEELTCSIRTVTPSRTFLEKAFLLNEEFQKEQPRSRRMSRHLYDLEKLMDTEYGRDAIEDSELYRAIVEHRRKFYHLGYVSYDLDYPSAIDFVPKGNIREAYRRDYNDNMVNGYIYGSAISFDTLIERMEELLLRFRNINITK